MGRDPRGAVTRRRFLILVVLVAIALGAALALTRLSSAQGYPSLPVDWDGDFDPGCKLVGGEGGWDEDLTNADYTGGRSTIERNVVGEGTCAAKFTNSPSKTMTRSEVHRSGTGPNPEFQYETLFYVPSREAWPLGTTLTQHKMNKIGAEPICYTGGLRIADGGATLELATVFKCTEPQMNGQQRFDLGPFPRDRWFAVKVYVRGSHDPETGAVRAWVDPDGPGPLDYEERLPLTHLANQPAADRVWMLRLGQYRQATDHTTTFFADGFHLDCLSRC
jgi:hypothetical protein